MALGDGVAGDRRDEPDSPEKRERERRRVRAHAAAAAMMGLPPRDRPLFVASFRDCRTFEFVDLMIGLAREVRATRPVEAATRVRLGLAALDTFVGGDRECLARSKAMALRELGNAYRLAGDLGRASTTLDEAFRSLGGVDAPDQMLEIQGIRAQILDEHNELPLIDTLLRSSLESCLGASSHSIGFFHLSIGSALQRLPEKSFARCEAALKLLDPSREPRLIGNAFHIIGSSLIRLGYFDDGLGFLRRSLAVVNRWGSIMDRIRVLWVSAKADQRRGGWLTAEQKLQNVSFCLTHLGQPLTTGLAFLDLGRTLAKRGRWLQAEITVLKASSIFAECKNERFLTAAEQTLALTGSARRRSASRIDELVEDLW